MLPDFLTYFFNPRNFDLIEFSRAPEFSPGIKAAGEIFPSRKSGGFFSNGTIATLQKDIDCKKLFKDYGTTFARASL